MPQRNTINRAATGFLDLFRSKVNGQGPDMLRTDVQPVVDVHPFLASGLLRAVATSAAVGSPPSNLNVPVPEGEAWRIYRVTLSLWTQTTLPVDETVIWGLQLQGLQSSAGVTQDIDLSFVTMGGAQGIQPHGASTVWEPNGSVILPPGINLQGQYVLDNTAANYDNELAVLYSVLAV